MRDHLWRPQPSVARPWRRLSQLALCVALVVSSPSPARAVGVTHATSTGIVGVQLERAKASEARHPVGEPLVRSYDEERTIVPVAGWGIEILTTSLPRAKLGQPYSAMLTADREVESWSVVSGSLPDGLSLSPIAGDRRAATISGTPSKWALGTHVFIVRARAMDGGRGGHAEAALTIDVDRARAIGDAPIEDSPIEEAGDSSGGCSIGIGGLAAWAAVALVAMRKK